MEKPPVIDKGKMGEIVGGCKEWWEIPVKIAIAQRDADVEWYEGKYLIPDYEYNLQQARQDTMREIFEEIEKTFNWIYQGVNEKPWQSLKSKYLIPPNPVGSAEL